MRKIRKTEASETRERPDGRTSRKSPMGEGIRKPLGDEAVVSLWQSLSAEGNSDWRIANIIAKEHNISPRSVEGKIRRLRRAGQIGENPNKKAKKHRPRDLILATRENMMAQGKSDGRIASEIAKATGAGVASLKTTISAMVRKGEIEPNPNNQVAADAKEYRQIRKRRKELQKLGLNDTSISKILAFESEIRNAEALRRMLWEMVRDKLLEKNSNQGNHEMEELILQRYEMMESGMKESSIARQMARERGKQHHTMGMMIYRAVHMGGCRENPN